MIGKTWLQIAQSRRCTISTSLVLGCCEITRALEFTARQERSLQTLDWIELLQPNANGTRF